MFRNLRAFAARGLRRADRKAEMKGGQDANYGDGPFVIGRHAVASGTASSAAASAGSCPCRDAACVVHGCRARREGGELEDRISILEDDVSFLKSQVSFLISRIGQ